MSLSNSNPNFIFHKEIRGLIHNDQYETNNAFDIYSLLNNKNKIYLACSDNDKPSYIKIYLFNGGFQEILVLKSHNEFISGCKYFCNSYSKKEYLFSSSYSLIKNHELIVWTILNENNYQETIILLIETWYGIRITFSLIFNNDNYEDFLIYNNKVSISNLLSIKSNKVIKKFDSKSDILYYLVWFNKKANQNYIIQCNYSKIIIFNPLSKVYKFNKIESKEVEGKNYSACIIYNRNNIDILCISNENGNIIFYDLFNNKIISIIKTNDTKLRQICEYNENYLMVVSETGKLLIIDCNINKIINKITSKFLENIKTIKIIRHKIYGEYLLLSGFIKNLIIFKNKYKIFKKNI